MFDQAKRDTLIVLVLASIIALGLLACIGIFGMKAVNYMNQQSALKQEVENLKQNIEMNRIIETTMADPNASDGDQKKIYKIEGVKLSPEDNFLKLIDALVLIIRENEIGVSKINYELDSTSTDATNMQKAGCSKMTITLNLTTTYPKFVKFIKAVTDYEYLIEVDSFNITGNRKNKDGYLKINLVLNLYAQG